MPNAKIQVKIFFQMSAINLFSANPHVERERESGENYWKMWKRESTHTQSHQIPKATHSNKRNGVTNICGLLHFYFPTDRKRRAINALVTLMGKAMAFVAKKLRTLFQLTSSAQQRQRQRQRPLVIKCEVSAQISGFLMYVP